MHTTAPSFQSCGTSPPLHMWWQLLRASWLQHLDQNFSKFSPMYRFSFQTKYLKQYFQVEGIEVETNLILIQDHKDFYTIFFHFPLYLWQCIDLCIGCIKAILVDLNEFSSVFKKMQHSHTRHLTTSNLLRITVKCRLRFSNEWPLEGAVYINLYGKILPGIPNFFVFCKLFKYWWFQTKQFTGLLEFMKLYKIHCILEIFYISLFSKTIHWL